jgi:hypothetical protein
MTTAASSSDTTTNNNNNRTSTYEWSLVEQCYLLLHNHESSTSSISSSSDNGATTTTTTEMEDGPGGGGGECCRWWEELPVRVVEVSSVQDLGTMVTLRFLEWCIDHPNGVAVLPTTGVMASIFIQTLSRFCRASSSSSFQEQVQHSLESMFQRSVETLSTGEATTTSTDTTTNKSVQFQTLQQQLLDKMPNVPDTSGISLVLVHEFFPMLPTDPKSGCWILRESYGKILQIPSTQIHVMDLVQAQIFSTEELAHLIQYSTSTPRTTTATTTPSFWNTAISKVEAYCQEYEQAVLSKLLLLGDTSYFYLDGMGLDGSIGMNQPTSKNKVSLTTPPSRLVPLNYCTAASLATDLGGIGPARSKSVMMPLSWETWMRRPNPHASTIIVLASGEGLAQMVQESLEENQVMNQKKPLSHLYGQGGSRLYLTSGAASLLSGRRKVQLANLGRRTPLSSSSVNPILEWATNHVQETTGLDHNNASSSWIPPHLIEPPSDYALVESFLCQMSLLHKVTVEELTVSHIKNTAPEWLQQPITFQILQKCAACRLRQKVQGGLDTFLTQGQTLLHTAPHHDDIMLSYHAVMHELLGRPYGDTTTTTKKENRSGGATIELANDTPSETNETTQILTTSNNKRKMSSISSQPHNEDTMEDAASSTTNGTTPTVQHLGEQTNGNTNHFAYLTSGFNSVPDDFLSKWIHAVRGTGSLLNNDRHYDYDYALVAKVVSNGKLRQDYNDLLSAFRRAFFANDQVAQQDIESIIFLRKVAEVFSIPLITEESTESDGSVGDCENRISQALIDKMELIRSEYLGEDTSSRQGSSSVRLSSTAQSSSALSALLTCARQIKGCMRETEVDRVWALSRMPMDRVHHLRSKFYMDKKPPTTEDDAMPVARLIRQLQPSMISVAFDPEGTGPDTHYKVLQIVADAVSVCVNCDDYLEESVKKRLLVWGYRNVWFTFSPSDATLLLPASSADLDLLHQTFVSCFTTQKEAAYPSPYYDGPFSGWSCTLQRMQMEHMKILLGESFFREHENPRIRNAEGFVFIKAMTVTHFLREVQGLKSTIEGSLN